MYYYRRVLDITENDLVAMGIKRGHRRVGIVIYFLLFSPPFFFLFHSFFVLAPLL